MITSFVFYIARFCKDREKSFRALSVLPPTRLVFGSSRNASRDDPNCLVVLSLVTRHALSSLLGLNSLLASCWNNNYKQLFAFGLTTVAAANESDALSLF